MKLKAKVTQAPRVWSSDPTVYLVQMHNPVTQRTVVVSKETSKAKAEAMARHIRTLDAE